MKTLARSLHWKDWNYDGLSNMWVVVLILKYPEYILKPISSLEGAIAYLSRELPPHPGRDPHGI